MGNLPMHPAIVHLPIGLAILVPILAIGLGAAVWKSWLPRRAWAVVVGAQVLLIASGLAAMKTGEAEGERVEHRISEQAIEQHEELAEQFLWGAGVTLAVAGTALIVPAPAVLAVATFGTIATAGLGFRVGHAGGELVYGPNGLAGKATAAAIAAEGVTTKRRAQDED